MFSNPNNFIKCIYIIHKETCGIKNYLLTASGDDTLRRAAFKLAILVNATAASTVSFVHVLSDLFCMHDVSWFKDT